MIRLLSLVAAILLVQAQTVSAQQSTRTAAPGREIVASRARPNGSHTGINVGGKPVFGAGGAFTWAEHPAIRSVIEGSPAAKVGIVAGDILLAVNGADGRDPTALRGEVGKEFVIRVRRGAVIREFTLTSVRAPAKTEAEPRRPR